MNISYDEVASDSKKLAEAMLSSREFVPTLFNGLNSFRIQISIYIAFVVASFFFLEKGARIDIWFGVVAFGLMHWVFLLTYASGYLNLYSMINKKVVEDLKLVRVLTGKFKVYGWVWSISIFLLGVVSLSTELNVAAIVFGNFIVSILGTIIFNLDMSRFQIPSLLGAISAAKDSLSKRS